MKIATLVILAALGFIAVQLLSGAQPAYAATVRCRLGFQWPQAQIHLWQQEQTLWLTVL